MPGKQPQGIPSADPALARRLERTEAMANAAFVDARAVVDPAVGAAWLEVAGVYAMFDGVGSPLTQTFGLGLFAPCLAPEFTQLEAFFDARGAHTCHEVSSFAADEVQDLLPARGYVPIEDSVVLIRSTEAGPASAVSRIAVRHVPATDTAEWARVSGEGWSSEGAELAAFVEQFGRVTAQARGTSCFIAEVDGHPIAAAALFLGPDVALLAGASTVPSARRQGAQAALLQARLAFAADRGIDLAMVVTQPRSASHRNAERNGFEQVYSRRKWERQCGSPERAGLDAIRPDASPAAQTSNARGHTGPLCASNPYSPARDRGGRRSPMKQGSLWRGSYNCPMDASALSTLPGADLVLKGLRDLEDGTESIEALLVRIGASKLRSLGLTVPASPSVVAPEHRLYARLEDTYGLAAHSRHNALVRRLVSFERALACARP